MQNKLHSYSETTVFSNAILHIIAIEFFLFSGEKRITDAFFHGGKAPLCFLITCGIYYLTMRKQAILGRRNLKTYFALLIWIVLSTFVFGKGNHDNLWLSYVITPFAMLLLISSTNFCRLRSLLLKYLTALTAISIIVQIGHDFFNLFPAQRINIEGLDRGLSLGIFTTEWGENRLASIYWEPGQFQIVIYYILLLFSDEWTDSFRLKHNLRKFGVLIIGILLTVSTTAYLVLMLMIVVVVWKSGYQSKWLFPIYLAFGAMVIYWITNSQAIQEKVQQSENEQEVSSYTIRMADNIGCLMVTMEAPIMGYGPGSDLLEKKLFSSGSMTNSNGWLYSTAQLGIPFVIFLWICMYRTLRYYFKFQNVFLLLVILIISQSNEAYITFPYLYLYVFYESNRRYVKTANIRNNNLL